MDSLDREIVAKVRESSSLVDDESIETVTAILHEIVGDEFTYSEFKQWYATNRDKIRRKGDCPVHAFANHKFPQYV